MSNNKRDIEMSDQSSCDEEIPETPELMGMGGIVAGTAGPGSVSFRVNQNLQENFDNAQNSDSPTEADEARYEGGGGGEGFNNLEAKKPGPRHLNFNRSSPTESVCETYRHIPRVNCPEKIVFCIDMSSEMNALPFRLTDGTRYSPLFMLKRVLEHFVQSKNRIDKRHEYSVVVLHETVSWLGGFTNDPKEIFNMLEDISETRECDSCDIGSLFESIIEKFEIPSISDETTLPPPFVFRVIFLYGRSNLLPIYLEQDSAIQKLLKCPFFFVDILYLHEPPGEDNKCQEIYDALCEIDKKKMSYIFEVTRNTNKLHTYMAKLLAHPLQRPFQNDTFYTLQLSDD